MSLRPGTPGTDSRNAGNLMAALVIVALVEISLHRIAGRLFLPHRPDAAPALRALVEAAPFLFHLMGVLGLGLLATSLARAIRRRELFPAGMWLALIVIGGVFMGLAGYGLVRARLPARLFVHLQISHAFLALLIAVAFVRSGAGRRARVGLILFSLPTLLHGGIVLVDRTGWFKLDPLRLMALARSVPQIWLLAFAVSGLLLVPRVPVRRAAAGLLVAVLAGSAVVVLLPQNFALAQSLAQQGWNLELLAPLRASTLAMLGAAVFGVTGSAWQLLATPGGARLAGYGLLAIGAAGARPGIPGEMLLASCGLLAMALGLLRQAGESQEATGPRVEEGAWRPFLERLATALTAGTSAEASAAPADIVVVEDDGIEITNIRGQRGGRPTSIRLRRRKSEIQELEVLVGTLLRGAAPQTFDGADLKAGLDGSISLWPGRAARYRARASRHRLPSPLDGSLATEPLIEIADLLIARLA